MRSVLHKILALGFLVLYTLVALNISINQHFCKGHLVETSFFYPSDCGKQADNACKQHENTGGFSFSAKCCENLKIESDTEHTSYQIIDWKGSTFKFLSSFVQVINLHFQAVAPQINLDFERPPPLTILKRLALIQVYRI